LRAAVAAWQRDHHASTLTWQPTDGGLAITDNRVGYPRQQYVLRDPAQAHAYRLLERPSTIARLAHDLISSGLDADEDGLRAWITTLRAAGLVFEDGGRFVALATRDAPLRVTGER